jgi:hypothetical protein
MTLIRKLALALSLAFLSTSYSNAQTVDPTTGNLINSGTSATDTTSVWNNGVYVNQLCFQAGQPGNCGPGPSVRPGGYINFSYGTVDLNQVININRALEAAGTGVQLSGFNYSFMAKNGNGWDNGQQDYLAAYVKLYGSGGNQIANYDYSAATNNKYNWTNFNFSETFATPYIASSLSTAQVGFVGRDNNFWAGNYGPEIYNVDFRLKYKVDPCATNVAYSTTCAGFSGILNTNNLLDSTQGGSYLNQAFAINTALQNAGVGALVHGFNYGFNWRVGTGFFGCTAWNQDGSCSWMMNTPAYANASVSLTNKNNQIIHQQNYSFSGDGTSGSVSDKFLLPTSLNQSMLGMGRITGSASGTGSSIEGAWASMIYTADPCVANPLHSPDCKGYAIAIAKQLAPPSTTTTDGTQTTAMDPTTGMSLSDPAQPAPPPPGALQPAASNPGSTPANQPPPQGGSQPRAGEVKTAGDNNKSAPSLSSVMNMISTNQARIGNEAKSVVQAAETAAAKDAQQAQQQAETVAGALTAQSISSSMTQASTGTGLTAVSNNQSPLSIINVASVASTSVVAIGGLRPATQSIFADPNLSLSSSIMPGQFDMYSLQSAPGRNNTQSEPDVPQLEGIKIGGRSTLTDAIEQRPVLPNATTQEQRTETVNRNAQPNELAGGVDIRTMATQPAGYQAYSFSLADALFYAPKEIYRNQVNVDNVRLLRALGSDKLHQDMVNLQYK